MSNVGKFPWNWIPKDRTRVKEETEKNQRLLKTGFHDRYDRCDHSDHSDHMETTFQRSLSMRLLRSLEKGIPKESGTFQDTAATFFNSLPTHIRNIKDYGLFCKSIMPLL